jgi:hypothetical protein
MGSRSHFAVGHFLGLVVFRDEHRPSPFKSSILPLVDLSVPPESFSTVPSRSVLPRQDLDRLLSWALGPYNTYRHRGSTSRGPCRARFVPPSGFGYPLGGLLPPKPGRACFIPTAFLGFFPSERSPLPRWMPRFRNNRTCMPLAQRDLPQAYLRTGAEDTDFQASTLARVPCCERGISPPPAGGSLGIFPFQGPATGRLALTSVRVSPHALRSPRPRARPHACLRVSISDRLARLEIRQRADEMSRTTLLGFPCLLVPTGLKRRRPWLMCSPHRRPAVTDRLDPDLRTASQRFDRSPAATTLGT